MLLSQRLSGPLLNSSLIFLNAVTYGSAASVGAGADDAVITPFRSAALVATGTPRAPRIVWKVVASAPTLVTTQLAGL